MSEVQNPLTPEVKALIGVTAEKVEASPFWGIEREGLRIFTNAIMDPDPRYWDDAFAKATRYGAVVAPPIYCSYIGRKTMAGTEDPITRAFKENPNSDGIGGVRDAGPDQKGALPNIPTPLKRILNAGNEIEVRKYPCLGDHIYSQASYSEIKGHITKDGTPMLVVTVQNTYTNQNGEVLCILRQSSIRR
jgi:hypothetical protein